MNNLQKLLLTAAFVSIVPSTKLLCEDEPVDVTTPSITKTVITFNPADSETETIPQSIASAMQNGVNTLATYKPFFDLGAAMTPFFSSYGIIAGLQGSHSIKNLKRNLLKADAITPEITLNINKGIRRNRGIMGLSLGAMALSVAYVAKDIDEQNNRLSKMLLNKTE